MENLKLTPHEQRQYGELFGICDIENTGKVTGLRASELFLTSGLSQEILHQVTELCGAKRLGHFGRSQFYIALKLIAAAQCGLPVSFDSLQAGVEIPLPRFSQPTDVDGRWGPHGGVSQGGEQDRLGAPHAGQLPPPPKHARSHSGQRPVGSFDVQHQQDASSPPTSPQTTSQMPQHSHPNNHTGALHVNNSQYHQMHMKLEKGWASFEDDHQTLISQETKQQWAHFSDHSRGGESSSAKADTSSVSSEAESLDDVWVISDEQRDYYINQFGTMQPDLKGVISGAVAKDFFEKSKLPVHELSKIWQLSDVNRDGALSLDEFCTAMHLVVLRRNEIELPDSLPPSLIPYVPFMNADEPFAADLPPGSTLKRLTPPSPQLQWQPGYAPVESPTSSCVSSPGTKPAPVNFEGKPVLADPDSKIVHPVAVRMSPDGQPIVPEIDGRSRALSDTVSPANSPDLASPGGWEEGAPPSSPTSKLRTDPQGDTHPPMILSTPLQGRPRPTPKKATTVPAPGHEMNGHFLLRPPPLSSVTGDTPADRPTTLPVGGETIPPPPPRPRSGHTRSSSLDNKVINPDDSAGSQPDLPPAVPPRPSAKEGSVGTSQHLVSQRTQAGFSAIDDTQSQQATASKYESIPSQESGGSTEKTKFGDGFSADRKSLGEGSTEDLSAEESEKGRTRRAPSLDKKDIQAAVRWQKERNRQLSQLNSELNQELQEVMEQRIALEIQLEHLRPFSS